MSAQPTSRIRSIDLLRGLIMILMALDHTREYFHYSNHFFDPTDPAQTLLPLFLTRFITHFCAPGFSLLAGIGAYLAGARHTHPLAQKGDLAIFLVKRGLWLVIVELIVMTFVEHFDYQYRDVVFETIWSLGISMILLSGLIYLPGPVLIGFCCVLIFGHNLLDSVHFPGNIFWSFIHEREGGTIFPGHGFFIAYPLVPWIAVMALGYSIGPFYNKDFAKARRKTIFNIAGAGSIALLVILRAINIYGDPVPWKNYGDLRQTVMSFLNFSKYPPSLFFLLFSLGGVLLFLANSENLKGKLVDFLCTFGRVPLFFYINHLVLIHLLAMLAAELTGFGWDKMILLYVPGSDPLKGFGFSLVMVYLFWIVILALIYPFCNWFDLYQRKHQGKWWLSYM